MKTTNKRKSGFTLAEILVAFALLGLVMGGAWSILIMINRMWNSGAAQVRAAVKVDRSINFVFYGGPGHAWTGVRDIVATNATLTTSAGGWVFNAGTNEIVYSTATRRITDVNGVAISDDDLASTASLTNSGLLLSITVVESNAIYTVTNSVTSFCRMRN